MTTRSVSLLFVLLLVVAVLVTPAAAKKKPPPSSPPPPSQSTSSTYVRGYADVLDGVACDVTPEAVQATADGGSIALTHADCRSTSWLVKFDAAGNAQWQREVGCLNLASGGYALGLAVEQTADGGYVIGGGTRGHGATPPSRARTARGRSCSSSTRTGTASGRRRTAPASTATPRSGLAATRSAVSPTP